MILANLSQEIITTIMADINAVMPNYQVLVASQRLLVGAAEEIQRTPGVPKEVFERAVLRMDNAGTLIDIFLDLLLCKISFTSDFLGVTSAPVDLFRILANRNMAVDTPYHTGEQILQLELLRRLLDQIRCSCVPDDGGPEPSLEGILTPKNPVKTKTAAAPPPMATAPPPTTMTPPPSTLRKTPAEKEAEADTLADPSSAQKSSAQAEPLIEPSLASQDRVNSDTPIDPLIPRKSPTQSDPDPASIASNADLPHSRTVKSQREIWHFPEAKKNRRPKA
ncbi:MAG: hypothetical protein E6713_11935 [Sporomusaceae bacterium]|nr:hypothetical protein [Sporomusaceae bacterium]